MPTATDSATRWQGLLQTFRAAMNLLWSVADKYAKHRLLLSLGLVATGAVLAAATPILLKMLIDALSTAEQANAGAALIALVLAYSVAQYFNRVSGELRTLLQGQAEQRVRRRIGGVLFEHVIRMPLRFHLDRKTGAMGETLEQGLRGYQLLLQHLVYTALPVTLEFGAVAVILVHFNHSKYLVILATAALLYVVAFHHWAKATHDPSERVAAAHIDAHAVLTDSLLNHETIKYFDAEATVGQRYDAALHRTEAAWSTFLQQYALNGALIATIFAASLAASLLLATNDVVHGVMTLGDFVLVNAYVVRLVQPLEMLGSAVRDIAQGLAFLSSMLHLFQERSESTPTLDRHLPGIALDRPGHGELVFKDVTFSYREHQTVLQSISFAVGPKRTVAVVGMSGSGKSSLIRLLFRLYEPDSGEILLDGTRIRELPLSMLRRSIAVVPQDTVLFHDTIAHNIGLGRVGATQAQIEEAARIAHLHDFVCTLPQRYETLVGERGLKLSGGERQRVAIARAALKGPRVFVFDEATSSLDSRTEREILRNIRDLSSHSTTFVIAHRLSTVVRADEILVLHHGAIVERGRHRDLLERNGHYAALWRAQRTEDQVHR
jgi:ATP-binding cassette subfamily B protein